MTSQYDRTGRGAAGARKGAHRRPLSLIICLAVAARLSAQEYIVMEETWRPGGINGWSAPAQFLTLSAPGGVGHAGALRGGFAQQGFPFPESDAFTATSGASTGKFARDYFDAGRRVPLVMGFDLMAEDVLPSSCLLRLSGGVGITNTFFRSVLPQLSAASDWTWIEVPLDSVSGWTGGTAAQFSNVLENVTGVELRVTRNGLNVQDYVLDNFTVVWRVVDAITDTDGDGLPDVYELAHTGSATAMLPGGDDDHDGTPNDKELEAGSDPSDAGSVLAVLSITKQNAGSAQMTVRTLPGGRNYQIERTTDLRRQPEPDWQPVGAPTAGVSARMTLSDDDPPPGACFYRIRLTR